MARPPRTATAQRRPPPPALAAAVMAVWIVLGVTGPAPSHAAIPGAVDRTDVEVRAGGPVAPVPGAVVRGFDPPDHPYGPGHRGVDLAARPADPVRAVLDGTVTFAGQVARVGWVTLDHGGGLRTTYGPVDPLVAAGEEVVAGQTVAWLSAGAGHLDWGARLESDYIDPLSLLQRWQLRLTARDLPQGQMVPVG